MNMLKEKWQTLCGMSPVVRKRMDVELGIYGSRKSDRPVVNMGIRGSWCYPLITALGILAAVMAVLWLLWRLTCPLRRLFS